MRTSVYVHFPWCLQKCPYCDFASGAIRAAEVPHAAYADAVVRELDARGAALEGAELASVFFGGGTPSLWQPEQVGRVLEAIVAAFGRASDELEVTLECNPSSLDRRRAEGLRAAGVNRLSVGVQSLDDRQLRFLGRMHDRSRALEALSAALDVMPRVNADVMFGMPGQTLAGLQQTLDELLATSVRHLSTYALTIEPGTQFGQLYQKGKLRLAPDDDYARLFLRVREVLEARGFEHYEVSNYAHPGQRSVHNQHYWQGGAYLGLGAGAVGCLHHGAGRARRYRNDPNPERYIAGGDPERIEVFEEHLGPEELLREALMLGLRTADGLDVQAAGERAGMPLLEARAASIERGVDRRRLVLEGNRLRVPAAHWLQLDSIVADLF